MATITASATGGNWSSTAAWIGGVVPTGVDDVKLAAGSGNITIDTNVACNSLDCTGYVGVLTHNAFTLTINGWLKLVAGMTYAPSAVSRIITFAATTNNGGLGWPITLAGKTLQTVNFNGVGGKWQLQDAFATAAGALTTCTNGTLDTNGKSVTAGRFTAGQPGFTLLAAGSAFSLGGTGTIWTVATIGGFTGPASIAVTDTSSTGKTLNFGGKAHGSLTISGGAGVITLNNGGVGGVGASITTLTLGAPGVYTLIDNGTGPTINTLICTGNPGNVISIGSSVVGTARYLKLSNAGSAAYTTFQDVNAGSGQPIYALDHCTDNGNNTNILFTLAAAARTRGLDVGVRRVVSRQRRPAGIQEVHPYRGRLVWR
jgi:hypothetical protein